MPKVTIIPATRDFHTKLPTSARALRRVAGYARVSTDNEEQHTSYEAQVDYYTNYIKANPQWDFVGVYTDDGISGTNTKKREGFNRMIQDALAGKIDLIVTKSVSRFARNTVDSLTYVRKLKDNGCEVYFEKENIYTFDSKGELLITIMSSLAQEESRSISENVTWGRRKQFADGVVTVAYSTFLGYTKGKDGNLEIVPEEAEIIKMIYRMFISGKTYNYIANYLTKQGVPTPRGKKVWQSSTVESILKNEKYKGSAILQKSFTVDFLQKKIKKNEGEIPQYYIEHNHPPIIRPEEWEKVQAEIKYRRDNGLRNHSTNPYAHKLICEECGGYYGSKLWHSTDKYRKTVWQCNKKFYGDRICKTPNITQTEIEYYFMKALNKLTIDRDRLIRTCKMMLEKFTDTAEIDKELQGLNEELAVVVGMIKKLIADHSITPEDQNEYNERYNSLAERYEAANVRTEELQKLKNKRQHQADAISGFLNEIENVGTLPIEYSEHLWIHLIDHAVVTLNEEIRFVFKNGEEISEILE